MFQIDGVYAPVITPFDSDGEVALNKLTQNLAIMQQRTPLHGFVVLGSTGEFALLDAHEKIGVFETARAAIGTDKRMIAGVGAESTSSTIRMARRAAKIGADALLVVTPNYYKPAYDRNSQAALVTYYQTVAEASPLPVLLYNVTALTGVDLSLNAIRTLIAHPNIVGMKESTPNVVKMEGIAAAVAETGAEFRVLGGAPNVLLGMMAHGAVGSILAVANVLADEVFAVWQAFRSGDLAAAQEAQHVLSRKGAVFGEGIAAIKYGMDARDWGYYGGAPRLPILPLDTSAQEAVRKVLS